MSEHNYWMGEALKLQAENEEQRKTIHELRKTEIDLRWELETLRAVLAHQESRSDALRLISSKPHEGTKHETHSNGTDTGRILYSSSRG